MSITIKQNLVPSSKYSIKCPHTMNAEYITAHNTYNDASAENEIKYMISNNNQTSYHYAVDDIHAVQGLPLNRNGWHAGDGNGPGNRKSIGIEICYSKSGGDRYKKAEANAVKLIAKLLKERGWGVNRVKQHYDWSKKNCPHRIRAEGRWGAFIAAIQSELNSASQTKPVTPQPTPKPTPTPTAPASKTIDQLAQEVIAGKHGTGEARKKALGSQYTAVQKRVNEIVNGKATASKPQKTISQLADEVMKGLHGTGAARKKSLGSNYDAVQKEVNRRLKK